MDPLSITASVITLADAVVKIHRFVQSIRQADAGLAALCNELQSLTGFSQSIARTLQDCQRNPLALAPIDADVWKQSRNVIMDSRQTIDDLSALVKRIGGPVRSSTIFRRTRIATEMHFHTREIIAFRDKIHMSNLSLQTLLQVINVSLSLRSNTSAAMTLRELRRLNQYLEISTRAAVDTNSLFMLDKSDAYVLQNLKNLVRAAGDFHTSASTKASTIYAGESNLSTDTSQDRDYAQSSFPATATSTKRRHIEMFLRRNRLPSRANSLAPSNGILSARPNLEHTNYPEVVVYEEAAMNEETDLDNLFSGGLSKIAQKALRKFDFPKAEKVLQQALNRHKISAPDDAHHSRLRTQLALCSFLQGKGPQIDEYVVDLAEFRGTKQSVAHQLLYNLALSHIHELDFKAARKICTRLWANLRRPNFPAYPKKNDLLRLLVVSYRMSGEDLLAEALEEEHPELIKQADDGLPSIMESVIGCEELLVEFFALPDRSEIPRLLIHQLRSRAETAKKSPFELSRVQQQIQKTVTASHSGVEYNDNKKSRVPSFPKRVAKEKIITDGSDRHQSSDNGRFRICKAILSHRRTLAEAKSDGASASIESPFSYASSGSVSLKGATHIKKKKRARSYVEGETGTPQWWKAACRWRKRPVNKSKDCDIDENSNRILSWMRSQDTLSRKVNKTSITSNWNMPISLSRRFSFEGMPSTSTKGPRDAVSMHLSELPSMHLVEMMDTSPRAELSDTGLTYLEIMNKYSQRHTFASVTAPSCLKAVRTGYDDSKLAVLGITDSERLVHTQEHGRSKINNAINNLHGYYGPKDTCGSDRVVSNLSIAQYIDQQQISCNISPGKVNGTGTKRTYIPSLIPNPTPTSLRRKGPCLYHRPKSSLIDTRKLVTFPKSSPSPDTPMKRSKSTFRAIVRHYLERSRDQTRDMNSRDLRQNPDQDRDYETGRITKREGMSSSKPTIRGGQEKWNAGPTQELMSFEGIIAIRNMLHLLTQWRRKPGGQNQDNSPEETHRVRGARHVLWPKGGCGEQIFNGGRPQFIKMAHEYTGPNAVPGPYTDHEHEPTNSPSRLQYGVPVIPCKPADIMAPVELDTGPIRII